MIAVDTNILVYAHRAESSFHDRASDCVKRLAEGSSASVLSVGLQGSNPQSPTASQALR